MNTFKKGARIKEPQRQQLIDARLPRIIAQRKVVDPTALILARDNLHKPWARRWLKQNGLSQ